MTNLEALFEPVRKGKMRIIRLPKNNGKFRTIYVPSRKEKAALRAVKHLIERRVKNVGPVHEVVHGFVKGRSPVTNAQAHVGHQFTLTMDLRDFFDSVTEMRLRGKLSKGLQDVVLVDGAARQGLPTSPAVANLAAVDIDKAILKLLEKHGTQVVYTRYADDLTFSYDNEAITSLLLSEIPKIVTRTGFKMAPEKTQLYRASAGRRMVTGVAVDDTIHPTRAAKRRLRAALHQGNLKQAEGLKEWMKLREPIKRRFKTVENGDVIDEVKAVAKAWNLTNISPEKIPDKGPDVDLGDNCVITGDPVLMLGMSTFTTGWKSCMAHPHGGRRRGTVFWMHLEGTRIAALFSDRMVEHGGVSRRGMLARCLVHSLEGGGMVIDRIYGDPVDRERLRLKLRAAGCMTVVEAKGRQIKGEAPARWKAWFDNAKSVVTKAGANGKWKKGSNIRRCHF